MKKRILVLGLLLAAAGLRADDGAQPSAADPGDCQPQWFLNGDGVAGVRTEPLGEAGHAIASLGAGLEYLPDYFRHLGLNADYDYLAESSNPRKRDNDLDLSLRLFTSNSGPLLGWLQAGEGYNFTPNTVNGHYLAFVEPGLRWYVAPRLAFDVGIQYMSQTPKTAFVQSFGVNLGLSIPLDASFIPGCAKAAPVLESSTPVATPESTPAATPSPMPAATPPPTPVAPPASGVFAPRYWIHTYVVRKGDDLWTIAGKTIGDPALWPLLVTAKGTHVRDPDSIFVGEKLKYRGAYTLWEIAFAVKKAAAYPTPSKDSPVP